PPRSSLFPYTTLFRSYGLTLGGGCEIAMHGNRTRAAAETYIGLVEVGVGLIPAGCGTKEMTMRAMDGAKDVPDADPLLFLKKTRSEEHTSELQSPCNL